MAGFVRRGFRRFRRSSRRRGGPETYTVLTCRQSSNVWLNTPCSDPLTIATAIFLPSPNVGLDASTAAATLSQKALTVQGIKFSAEHYIDPSTALDGDIGQIPSNVAFILTIWEAIIVLPLLESSKVIPQYIPRITQLFQSADLADRVLWKRITHAPFWGLNVQPGVQLQTNVRDTDHGNQVVKANCRLDDRHGLFYVRAFVHDIAGLSGADSTLPVVLDSWWKIFYRVRFS